MVLLQRVATILLLFGATVPVLPAIAQTTVYDGARPMLHLEVPEHWAGFAAQNEAASAGITVDEILVWLSMRKSVHATVLAQEPDAITPDYVANSARICTELAKQALTDSFVTSPCTATSIAFGLTCGAPEQLRKIDIEQYFAARSEASEREISMSALLLERIQQDRACRAVDRAAREIEIAADEDAWQRKADITSGVAILVGIIILLTILLAVRSARLTSDHSMLDSTSGRQSLGSSQSKVADFMFAKDAPKGWRRIMIVLILAAIPIWVFSMLQDAGGLMRVGVSEWIALFVVSALIVIIPLSLLASYFYLPRLGRRRGWELTLFLEAPILFATVYVLVTVYDGYNIVIDDILAGTVLAILPVGLGLIFVTKLVAWIAVGFRSR